MSASSALCDGNASDRDGFQVPSDLAVRSKR